MDTTNRIQETEMPEELKTRWKALRDRERAVKSFADMANKRYIMEMEKLHILSDGLWTDTEKEMGISTEEEWIADVRKGTIYKVEEEQKGEGTTILNLTDLMGRGSAPRES